MELQVQPDVHFAGAVVCFWVRCSANPHYLQAGTRKIAVGEDYVLRRILNGAIPRTAGLGEALTGGR